MMRATARLAALITLVALVVAACGGGSSASPAAGASGAAGGSITVTGAWVRAAAAGGETAAYFTIANGTATDDALIGVATDAAQSASVHQTSTDANGMTGMQMTPSVKVPAGGSVAFAPGGYHVMLANLKADLAAGGQVHLTLNFEKTGAVAVTAEVRAN